jgi:hypothetical protein
VEVAEKQMAMRALTVEEYRNDEGLPPLTAELAAEPPRRVDSTLGQPEVASA